MMLAALLLVGPVTVRAEGDAGQFVRLLWLFHEYGMTDAVAPAADSTLKGRIIKAMGRDGVIEARGAQGLMDPQRFGKLAGADGRLDADEVSAAVQAVIPPSRGRLAPTVAAHAAMLSTSFDQINPRHHESATQLARWIASRYRPGQRLDVIVICTGNSRRSMLGAVMGNIAAAYYGMPEVRFHSGGTEPSAFNRRTIQAMTEIGVEVIETGQEAPRGTAGDPNPVYHVRWGGEGDPAMEQSEFSKCYDDPANPQRDFCAVLVCGEADAGCPVVKGAATRISMPFLDPKIFDGSAYESLKYAERRDDIGRTLLSVLLQARSQLGALLPVQP
jgi:hypothetical protein